MFTGIIEDLGEITAVEPHGSNITFKIKSDLGDITVDDSISCNGVCLTVEKTEKGVFTFTAIEETITKTNAGDWHVGYRINLERTLTFNGRIDGHLVQGHVDGTGICERIITKDGSSEFIFSYDNRFATLIIEKGSICVNGTSLTAFNVTNDHFTVAIIPYTFAHTTFKFLKEGDKVNLEFDILGKYIQRNMDVNDGTR